MDEDEAVPFDEALHALCDEHDIAAVYVFGPPDRGKAGGAADPDVGVVFGAPARRGTGPGIPPPLLGEFRKVFGAEALAVGDVQQMGPFQQYRALQGRVVYAVGGRRAEFEEQVVRDYQDFTFEMRLFDEERAEEITREGDGG